MLQQAARSVESPSLPWVLQLHRPHGSCAPRQWSSCPVATEATASAILTNDQIGLFVGWHGWSILGCSLIGLSTLIIHRESKSCHRESKSCDVPDNNLTDSFSSRPKSSRECARSLRMVVIMCWSRAFLVGQQDVSILYCKDAGWVPPVPHICSA